MKNVGYRDNKQLKQYQGVPQDEIDEDGKEHAEKLFEEMIPWGWPAEHIICTRVTPSFRFLL
jgi:hypothetical protein